MGDGAAAEDILGDGSIMKTIIKAAPPENTESPALGHKVKVHYTGTLTSDGSKFDSSRDRDAPFDFTVGSGVITGWSEAVPTMKLGEVAKFTICSDKAYGASGSPPKIPPNASLDFEIELLSFTDRDDVLRDGSLMKKVLARGGGDWKTPNEHCDVDVKVKDGDEWVDRCWVAGGAAPVVGGAALPAVLRRGVEGMKRGERASFLASESGVDFEVEVVDWVENEECVPASPGAVVKRVVKARPEGDDDWKTPQDEATVGVRGGVWRRGDATARVDYGGPAGGDADPATWCVDEDLEATLGGGAGGRAAVCAGVEAAVKKMKRGEVATVRVSAEFGFASGPLAGCDLDGELELVTFDEEPQTWELKGLEKLEQCEAKKTRGNAHVKRGDFARAARRYGAALNIGASDYDLDDDTKAKLAAVVAATKLNRAMCHLKLGDFGAADKDCGEVLEKDPGNVKALFRKAKAQVGLDHWAEAKALFRKVLDIEPKNADARRGLVDIAKKEKAHKEKEKALYAGRKLFADAPKKKSSKQPAGPNAPVAYEPQHAPGPDATPADAPPPKPDQ